jgi:excisionase family DNA binding protein
MDQTSDAGAIRAEGPMGRKLLDIEEAAEVLSVHYATLYRWAKAKKIPCIRMGARVIRFDPRALEKFLQQNTVEVRSDRPA